MWGCGYAIPCQLRIQGGGGAKGAMPPLSLLKLVIKKMAAIGGPLYFMFLAPPPTILDPMLPVSPAAWVFHLLPSYSIRPTLTPPTTSCAYPWYRGCEDSPDLPPHPPVSYAKAHSAGGVGVVQTFPQLPVQKLIVQAVGDAQTCFHTP